MVSSGKTKQDQKKKNQGMLFLRLFNAEKKMGSALNVNLPGKTIALTRRTFGGKVMQP